MHDGGQAESSGSERSQDDASPAARLERGGQRAGGRRRDAVARCLRRGQAVQDRLMQPLSGAAAAGGQTALVGIQMAVDRINNTGGIHGRPIELIVADYESKPDVGRRKAEKLVSEDKIDVQVGGFLSNV